MALAQKRTIQELFRKYYIRPSKKLGQNFLVDNTILLKIIEIARLKPKDIVLEIGPGVGNLTQEIAKRVKTVIAIEKDPKMVEILKENVKTWKCQNVKIIQEDILKFEAESLGVRVTKSASSSRNRLINYKVVANLPFYLTAPVIRKFLESKFPPKEMILVVQKEVAQRITAVPPRMTRSTSSGSSRASRGMNLLAISVQFYAKPEILGYVSKESFWPQPKVDAAILKIVPRRFRVPVPRRFRDQFFRIVKAGFSHPRKQLANNLSSGLELDKEKIKSWLLKNKISPERRAETLSLEDWLTLVKNFRFFLLFFLFFVV